MPVIVINCRIAGKQYKHRSEAFKCGFWSGSILSTQALQIRMINTASVQTNQYQIACMHSAKTLGWIQQNKAFADTFEHVRAFHPTTTVLVDESVSLSYALSYRLAYPNIEADVNIICRFVTRIWKVSLNWSNLFTVILTDKYWYNLSHIRSHPVNENKATHPFGSQKHENVAIHRFWGLKAVWDPHVVLYLS